MVQPTMTHHQAVATDMIPILTTLPDRRDMEMILRHLLIPQGMQHTICNKNYRGFHIKLNSYHQILTRFGRFVFPVNRIDTTNS